MHRIRIRFAGAGSRELMRKGMHLMGIHLMGVHLMCVHLMGVHLMCVHLMGMPMHFHAYGYGLGN